jgi:hypothetical protein
MPSNALAAALDDTSDDTVDVALESSCAASRRPIFEAATPFGPIRLSALDGAPARHAADAAIALDRYAPLLDALEMWFDHALDWRWLPTQSALVTPHATVGYRDGGSAHSECEIGVPWALLRGLSAPPPAMAELLHWPAIPAVLTAAALDIPPAELAELEPGGALVLPESLRPDWQGRLRASDEPAGQGVAVSLAIPTEPRVVSARSASSGEPSAYEVRLDSRKAMSADQLTGWSECVIGEIDDGASLWHCGIERDADRCVARGRLIPWGTGWALAIETLCGEPETIDG